MPCDHLITIKQKTKVWNPVEEIWEDSIRVPCGKCLSCKKKRVNQWSFRLMQEYKVSYSAYFVTLTYDTDYVPLTKRGFMTLVKTTEQYKNLEKQHRYEDKDVSLQGFIKRLRYYEEEGRIKGKISLTQYKKGAKTGKYFTEMPVKYYGVGEYGSKRFRPHYHLIVFNVHDIENIKRSWTFGETHIDEVNKNTVDYTLKYINKDSEQKRQGFDGIKQFSLMSKGLGKSFITEDAKRFYSKEYNNVISDSKGIKTALPRYYSQKLVDRFTKEKKAVWNYKESEKRKEEEERMGRKYGYNPEEIKQKIAFANKYKLSKPIKDRGND